METSDRNWAEFDLRDFADMPEEEVTPAWMALREWCARVRPDGGKVAGPSGKMHRLRTGADIAEASHGRREACFHDLGLWILHVRALKKRGDGFGTSPGPLGAVLSLLKPLVRVVVNSQVTDGMYWVDDGAHDKINSVSVEDDKGRKFGNFTFRTKPVIPPATHDPRPGGEGPDEEPETPSPRF